LLSLASRIENAGVACRNCSDSSAVPWQKSRWRWSYAAHDRRAAALTWWALYVITTLAILAGQLGSNAKSAASSMPKATRSDSARLIHRTCHSLHFGLRAPPTASQASVPGVAREAHDVL